MIKRTESLIDGTHCSRLKDLLYFRQVLKEYDLAIIKQFILQHVLPIRILQYQQIQLSKQYRYIPHQNATILIQATKEEVNIKEGVPLEQMEGNIIAQEDLTLYSISLKTQFILTKLNDLQFPILFDLKSCEKLMFLAKCEVSMNNFGTYIFRKGQPVEALYFLIEGQIKIYKKTNEKTIELGTIQKDRMFGLYCLKHEKTVRQLSAKASQNNTQVLIIEKQHLDRLCQDKQITLSKLLQEYKTELHFLINTWSVPKRPTASQEQIRKAEQTLEKRVKHYHRERNIKNKEIEKLMQTKSLLFKVRDLNESIKKESQRSPSFKRYAFDISTSSNKRRKITDNPARYTQATITPRQGTFCTSMVRSFVGLTKSASVRRYLTKISRRQ